MDSGSALGALADPTRRAIVQRLALGPATATQLAELAPMSRPAVSQHLTTPVTYVELDSPDLEATTAFMRDVTGGAIVWSFHAAGSRKGVPPHRPGWLLIGLHEYDSAA